MSKRASRRRGKEGQELSDIEVIQAEVSAVFRKRVRNYRILTQVIQTEVSMGLSKRVRKIQREGSERMGFRHRERG